MQRKLNGEFIREYSEQFSEKITSDFFADNDTITGREILKVTPSKQVNFFILMILFGKWQEEMKKLESPFFNYKSNEVRRAMVDFMNTLSQHIEVEGDYFVSLVEEAVQKTLTLLLAPDLFLEREFEGKNITSVNEKITKPIFKYLKLHKYYLDRFLTENVGQNLDSFMENARDYFSQQDFTDEIEAELEALGEVIPISLTQLTENLPPREEVEEEIPSVADEDDLDEIPDDMEDEFESSDEPENEEPEEVEEEQQFHKAPHSVHEEETLDSEEDEVPDSPVSEAFESEESYEEEESPEEPEEEELSEDEEESLDFSSEEESLNEKFSSEQQPTTINDKFSSEEGRATIADQMQKGKVTNIMEAISVNHRYMFTKELFDGDREAFNAAIGRIEECESFDDAVELLVQNFAKEREWDMNSEEVKELLKMVFRKFR